MTAAIVLAAGDGGRFLGPVPKLLFPFCGRALVAWAMEHALEAGFAATGVVTGAIDLHAALPAGVEVIRNPAWATGQASSLRAGLAWAESRGEEAVVVGLGDQPLVPAAAWAAVAAGQAPLVVASFGGRRSPPVRLSRAVWSLVPVSGDEGARSLLRQRPDLVQEVACGGSPVDIDTIDDLLEILEG